MLQRWLVVIIGLPLLLAALLLCPDWATVIVVCGIAAAAAYELLHTAGKKVPKCVYAATILAAVALEWVIYDEHTWQFYDGYDPDPVRAAGAGDIPVFHRGDKLRQAQRHALC